MVRVRVRVASRSQGHQASIQAKSALSIRGHTFSSCSLMSSSRSLSPATGASSSGSTCCHRQYSSSSGSATKDITLYQYAICPFCNIVKSVLHYQKIPYNAVEVNPLTKAELKDLPKDYRKVPILTTTTTNNNNNNNNNSNHNGQYNGSEKIVDYLLEEEDEEAEQSTIIPEDPKWVAYARDDLAPLLYPNICQTWSKAHETMGYIHSKDEFTTLQKYSIQWVGSLAMYMAASKIKKKRQISDERQALFDTLQQWEEHLEETDGNDYHHDHHDHRVTLGDLSIYGVLRGLDGLPVHSDIITNFASIAKWYKLMEEKVEG